MLNFKITAFLIIFASISLMRNIYGMAPAETNNSRIKVEIKDNWFYVNNERFFIKGVNYCGWRPGESPHELNPIDLELADNDFRMIKAAGFNTIRTSGGLTPELISLAKKHGLMVMHGIWFNPDIDYSDSEQIKYAAGMLKSDLSWSKNFDNIICFLVMNEPGMDRVRDAGKLKTETFLRNLKDTVKTANPKAIVSFANWVPLAFLDHSFWDAVCFNVYEYSPATITHSLGYQGYIEWLKETFAKNKPLVITEFGLSVSPKAIGERISGHYGYGGNTLSEQKVGDLKMYDDLIQANAVGGCIFNWIDEWWMVGDKSTHDNHPEEYFGIVDTDSNSKGVPRPAYYALKEYNQALIIVPKKLDFYAKELPIEVYATEQARNVQYRLDNEMWADLKKDGAFWWKTMLDISKLADGMHTLEIKALDKNNKILCLKKQGSWISNLTKPSVIPYKIKITTDKEEYGPKEKMKITITVNDAEGNPVPNQTVYYSFFQPIGWDEYVSQKVTDDKGAISTQFSTLTGGYLTIAAGVAYKDNDYEKRFGDVKAVLFK